MAPRAEVMALLRQFGIRPSKGLGQNFLVDERVVELILAASELTAEDNVLEVGPGLGLLTRQLAQRAARVVAVELDRKMIAVLGETLRDCANVRLVPGDILEIDPVTALAEAAGADALAALRYKVVANLPYYITSAAIRHLLSLRVRPVQLTVMVQHEVAQRLAAAPGDLSLLAISVQIYGVAEIVAHVPANAFYPAPNVDSAIVRIRMRHAPLVPEEETEHFFAVVRAGFAHKRKQLHNSLAADLGFTREGILERLARAGVAPDRRPQTLTIEEWIRVTHALAA